MTNPTFADWDWNGDENSQTLSGVDPIGAGACRYIQIAEIRKDGCGHYWACIFYPEFWMISCDEYDSHEMIAAYPFSNMQSAQEAIEYILDAEGVI